MAVCLAPAEALFLAVAVGFTPREAVAAVGMEIGVVATRGLLAAETWDGKGGGEMDWEGTGDAVTLKDEEEEETMFR